MRFDEWMDKKKRCLKI